MTREETKGLVMMIQAAFPNFRPVDKTVTINRWFRDLQHYDCESMSAALDWYIATETKGFAPSAGQLIDRYWKTVMDFPSPDEAYAMYRKAISRASCSQEEFDKLPEIIQDAVGDPYNIYTTGTSHSYNEAVTRSNFLKAYDAACERKRERAKLSQSALALTNGGENIALPGVVNISQ